MSRHRQVAVKVNARVDQGVAELVTALSAIEGLETIESCQGGVVGRAFVLFRYGGWRDAGDLLFEKLLPRIPPDLRSDVALSLEAYDSDTAMASISMEPSAVPAVAASVRTLPAVGPRIPMAGGAHGERIAE